MSVSVRNKRRQECTKCGEIKPLSEFWRDSSRSNGRVPACKVCESERLRRKHTESPEVFRARSARWREKNRERHLKYSREYQKNRGKRLKTEVMAAYGGCCSCCGENSIEFLCIDHEERVVPPEDFHPNGARRGGVSMYYKLKRGGFPEGYRVLCFNCNVALSMYGICPHMKEVDG